MSRKTNNPLLNDAAIAIARAALSELDDGGIGRHIGVSGMNKCVVTHRFEAHVPGYPGWEWHAVLACAQGSPDVTVNEVALVPGNDDALQAPEWVPWEERVRPGDLGPGDLMPPLAGDERLDAEGNLSPAGLEEAKQRWRRGDFGPNSHMAAAAPLQCRTCAFMLPLMANFGVCANEYSADGHVVHVTYGCGAHSKMKAADATTATPTVFDDEKPLY